MNRPTLLVDIGNTRVKWTVVHADDDRSSTTEVDPVQSALHDDFPRPLSTHAPERIVFTNVASAAFAERVFAHSPNVPIEEFKPSGEACGVVNGYRHPERLGADRWAALIGAHASAPERDVLVCALGTATTIDLLKHRQDGRACFVGGMILPGIDTMRRSLARDTARLPLAAGTPTDFATDTDDAIASGIVAAQVGAVEHTIARARSVHGTHALLVVLTGGHAASLASSLTAPMDVRVHPDLVLHGLAIVARRHGPQ